MLSSGYLDVSDGHSIYYETYGTRTGKPAVVLHGGPGGGSHPDMAKIYDLKKWYVVLFDQRGCGKSKPFLKLEHNTTWDLVADIEALREYLDIPRWFVSGGSWGTTLALVYAITNPTKVTGLLLRGVCLGNQATQRWLYEKGGASEIYPEGWKLFTSVLPLRLHDKGWKEIALYYQKKLKSADAQRYADAWWGWESSVSRLIPQKDTTPPKTCLALAIIENHYFVHDCWLKEGYILQNIKKLRHIPITIVHGRYDVVCPITQAFDIKRALPHTKLHVVLKAGHAAAHPGIRKELRRATNQVIKKSGTRKKM
jgi:proline iminopeptidase